MRVKIDGVFQTSGSLAAFVGDEMRALATPSAVLFGPLMNDGTVLFMMSFWADQAEQLTWKFCDGARMVVVDPPCSFTDAAVGLPPFLPKCTRAGPISPYGGPFDVAQYFTGTTDQCTIPLQRRLELEPTDLGCDANAVTNPNVNPNPNPNPDPDPNPNPNPNPR